MTPAEELLAAIKEHATADVDFKFLPRWPKLGVSKGNVTVNVIWHNRIGSWCEDVFGYSPDSGIHPHASASSAVYSAFLRARK